METKHTKGKWTINKYNTIVDEKGETIRVTGLRLAGHISEEVQAYAKLIAAAPELLEALIELEDKTRMIMSQLVDSPKEIIEDITLQKAINAIKKATE